MTSTTVLPCSFDGSSAICWPMNGSWSSAESMMSGAQLRIALQDEAEHGGEHQHQREDRQERR